MKTIIQSITALVLAAGLVSSANAGLISDPIFGISGNRGNDCVAPEVQLAFILGNPVNRELLDSAETFEEFVGILHALGFITGGDGSDAIYGDDGGDIQGGGGNDTIYGDDGGDFLMILFMHGTESFNAIRLP